MQGRWRKYYCAYGSRRTRVYARPRTNTHPATHTCTRSLLSFDSLVHVGDERIKRSGLSEPHETRRANGGSTDVDEYEAGASEEGQTDVPLPPRFDAQATDQEVAKEKAMYKKWQREAQQKNEGLGGGPGLLRDSSYVRD